MEPASLPILVETLAQSEFLRLVSYQPRSITVPPIRDKALCVIGVRRAGKSTLLRSLWDGERKKNALADHHLLHINFFDDRLLPFETDDFQSLIDAHTQLYPARTPQTPLYLFLDEVQLTSGWELFVSRMLRRPDTYVFLSGSSSRMLSREIATSMRGRAVSCEVFPFSFEEYCTINAISVDYSSIEARSTALRAFGEFLHQGGFPEILSLPPEHRRAVLQEYLDVMLLRDVIERNEVSDALEVKDTLKVLLNQIAAPYSYNRLVARMKSVGHKLTLSRVSEYLAWFEDCYLLFSVPVLSPSRHRQMTNPKKLYCVDNAIWRNVCSDFVGNAGQLLENAVYLHFRRQQATLHYFRDSKGREVDFIVDQGKTHPLAIQVTTSINDDATNAREVEALVSSMQELDLRCGTIVVGDLLRPFEEKVDAGTIFFVPAYEFMSRARILDPRNV